MSAPMPIMPPEPWTGPRTVIEPLPWEIIAPHREQAMQNHGQTLECLRSRGGLSACEAVAILEDRRWHRMDAVKAFERLAQLVAAVQP